MKNNLTRIENNLFFYLNEYLFLHSLHRYVIIGFVKNNLNNKRFWENYRERFRIKKKLRGGSIARLDQDEFIQVRLSWTI